MGNLLGSPITEKDTHVGTTRDSNVDHATSPDGGGLPYGISSMQGWRIHMEDAHIAQPFLYAERLRSDSVGSDAPLAIEAKLSKEEGEDNDNNDTMTTEVEVTTKTPKKSASNNNDKKYVQIPLPNHALFAVFDGHGGSFAAEYASRNLLRVLTRDENFCLYAEKWRGRESFLKEQRKKFGGNDKGSASETATSSVGENDKTPEKELDDKARLQQLKKRGLESDEKVKQMKEKVRQHLDGDSSAASTTSDNGVSDSDLEDNSDYQYAKATYDHEMMTLLEHALRDAFIDLDAEILMEVRGEKVTDANLPYGAGYDLSQHSLEGCVGHLAPEALGDATYQTADHPTPSEDEDAGTTAVAVMVTPKWIVCANAGDSRAVYARSSHRAVPLSYDHKPDDDDEERRVREAGGYVSGGRVEGDLAVSRGLGDFRFKDVDAVMSGSAGERKAKSTVRRNVGVNSDGEEDVAMMRPGDQKVSPVPDIIVQNRDVGEDEFIVIACDGIWDVQTNQECVRMVADIFAEGEDDLGLISEEILDQCLFKGSKDNMTASVIQFPKQAIGKGGGVTARRERRGAGSPATDEDRPQGGGGQLRRVPNPYVPPGQREEEEEEGKGDE